MLEIIIIILSLDETEITIFVKITVHFLQNTTTVTSPLYLDAGNLTFEGKTFMNFAILQSFLHENLGMPYLYAISSTFHKAFSASYSLLTDL